MLQNIKNRDKLKTESDAAKRRAEDLNTLLCQTIKTPLMDGGHSKHYSSSLDIDRLLLGIAKTRSFIICHTKHTFMAKPYEINRYHLKSFTCLAALKNRKLYHAITTFGPLLVSFVIYKVECLFTTAMCKMCNHNSSIYSESHFFSLKVQMTTGS